MAGDIEQAFEEYEERRNCEAKRRKEEEEAGQRWWQLRISVVGPTLMDVASQIAGHGLRPDVRWHDDDLRDLDDDGIELRVAVPERGKWNLELLFTTLIRYSFRNGQVWTATHPVGEGGREVHGRPLEELTPDVIKNEATEALRSFLTAQD
jgi:hypothetical protein